MNVLGKRVKFIMTAGLLVGGLAFLGMSCSSGGGKPNPKNVTEKNICEEFAKVECYNMWNCCSGKEIEDILGSSNGGLTLSRTEGKCREDMKLYCDYELAAILKSVNSGQATVDKDKATACLKALLVPKMDKTKLDPCFIEPTDNQFQLTLDTNCLDPSHLNNNSDYPWLTGTVAARGDCANSFECVAGTSCTGISTSQNNPIAVGKCIADIAKGGDCKDSTDGCAKGLYCVSSSTANNGNPCTAGGNDTCSCIDRKAAAGKCCQNDECAVGLYCDVTNANVTTCSLTGTTGATTGSCTAYLALGASCYSSTDDTLATSGCGGAVTGLTCEIGVCSNDNKMPCTKDTGGGEGSCDVGTIITNKCNNRVCVLAKHSTENFCGIALDTVLPTAK